MAIAKPVEIVILAGGLSKRFHGVKVLAPVGGKPMLADRIQRLQNLPETALTVVVGAHRREVEAAVDFAGVKKLVNRHWREGMASSIRCAVDHAEPGTRALLFCAADQILVGGAQVESLLNLWRHNPGHVVAAYYNEQSGIPAIFPRATWGMLEQLRGDRGAKVILQQNAGRVLAVPMPEAAVDIDTREELTAFLSTAPGG